MTTQFFSRFTPSLMPPETLEAIFVQREPVARRLVDLIRESATTENMHHTLLTGPRGIGKTHLTSLVYHRVRAQEDLRGRLVIAWLREEEWGVDSFFELLRRILIALQKEYKDVALAVQIEDLHKIPLHAVEQVAGKILKDYVAGRALLVIIENLDDIFDALGDAGQMSLRSYIQENPFWTILATAQSLFGAVSLQTSPFYGFFGPWALEGLTTDEAVELLAKVARARGDSELETFVRTPAGRARLRAIRHLAGGNHRVHIILSQFITKESLDDLVDPVMQMLDDLTPYYQARMQRLEPPQRKIVEILCEQREAMTVAEIAEQSFFTVDDAAPRVRDLEKKGYLQIPAEQDSYYELREPLMRLCLEVKKERTEPIRLFVDFLRLWYSREELQQHLESLSPRAPERAYLVRALATTSDPTEDLVKACLKDYQLAISKEDLTQALPAVEDLVSTRGTAEDWLNKAACLLGLHRAGEAIEALDAVLERASSDQTRSMAGILRADALRTLGRSVEALAVVDAALVRSPELKFGLSTRAAALRDLGRHEEALAAFDEALRQDSQDRFSLMGRAGTLLELHRNEEALDVVRAVVEGDPTDVEGWNNVGVALIRLERFEEGLAAFTKATELNPRQAEAWNNRGATLIKLSRWTEALESIRRSIELRPEHAGAWSHRAAALNSLGLHQDALAAAEKAVALDDQLDSAWANRARILWHLGSFQESLASADHAISLDADDSFQWGTRAIALMGLGRPAEALEAIDRFFALGGATGADLNWGLNTRGALLLMLGRTDEALAEFDRAVSADQTDAIGWANRAVPLMQRGDLGGALASLDKALAIRPQVVEWWNNRALLESGLGRHDEAVKSLDRILYIKPDSVDAWQSRGTSLVQLGAFDDALKSYEMAARLAPRNAVPIFSRLMVLFLAHRWTEAIEALDSLLWTSPNQTSVVNLMTAVFHNLLQVEVDPGTLRSVLRQIVVTFAKFKQFPLLTLAVVNSIPSLRTGMVSTKKQRLWRELWWELGDVHPQLDLARRLLDTAVRYLAERDPRILLKLPSEERALLQPLVG